MSLSGAKSSSKPENAALTVSSDHGFPIRAFSTAVARLGIPAMPPKAIRASLTTPSDTVMLKQPQTAEMS